MLCACNDEEVSNSSSFSSETELDTTESSDDSSKALEESKKESSYESVTESSEESCEMSDESSSGDESSDETQTETETSEESSSEAEPIIPPTDDPSEDNDYREISCRSVLPAEIRTFPFVFEGSDFALTVNCPNDWSFLKKSDSSYTIKREEEIGLLFVGKATDADEWKSVSFGEENINGVKTLKYIEKFGTRDTLKFRYRYEFVYTENDAEKIVTMIVDYKEISYYTASVLLHRNKHISLYTDPKFNTLSDIKDGNYLILGNSFINTSSIGSILNEMLLKTDKNSRVTAISRGYATVTQYISHEPTINDIKSGKYDAVFICGFYSSTDTNNLEKLKEVCDEANTKLIIFPAHNEKTDAINSAVYKYDGILSFVNWKGEVDALINSGVSKWDMCIDDEHLHSRPLAGYVGAHMIYRAIYGEIPNVDLNNSIYQEFVDNILGDYSNTGRIPTVDFEAIIYLK